MFQNNIIVYLLTNSKFSYKIIKREKNSHLFLIFAKQYIPNNVIKYKEWFIQLKNETMNIQNLIEDFAKVVILQNDRIRNATDYISKVNTLTTYDQILDYKVYCERMLSMIAYNMYPTLTCNQKQQLLHFFYHQKEECDKALQRLAQDALKDKLISKLAERRTNNINWR